MGKRKKVHPEYYRIPAYQILLNKSNAYMANELGIAERTYVDKIKGWTDFTTLEGRRLSEILQKEQDDLF